MSIKVHGSPLSTATRRVLACLNEKELEFELVPVDMGSGAHKKEPFISLNPFGQVPAMQDGDLTLFESRAITKYVACAYATEGTQLWREEPMWIALTQVGVWAEVEVHQFDPPASKLAWEIVSKPILGMTTDPAAVEENEAKLGKVLDVYEARLAQCEYLGGYSFSLADLHHQPVIQRLFGTRVKELFDSRTHVAAWCADILARPAWLKVLAMQKD